MLFSCATSKYLWSLLYSSIVLYDYAACMQYVHIRTVSYCFPINDCFYAGVNVQTPRVHMEINQICSLQYIYIVSLLTLYCTSCNNIYFYISTTATVLTLLILTLDQSVIKCNIELTCTHTHTLLM